MVCSLVCYRYRSWMLVSLIYIIRSTPLTIQRLPKPVSEFRYVTSLSSLHSTIHGWFLTPMSINYVIKVMGSYCDTIAIGDISSHYELIWSQLSTNWYLSPFASESALSHTHRVCNGVMIAANNSPLNFTTLYWGQIYRVQQLCCFAIYRMESILRHSGPMSKSPSPQTKEMWSKWWLIYTTSFGWQDSDLSIIGY
jgi:hypothetical protein